MAPTVLRMTYEYECTSCRHTWDAEQRITEAPLKVCAQCARPTAQRLISGSSFVLKGSGWYRDGYAGSSRP